MGSLPAKLCWQDGKGYDHVEGEDAQAANQPGQVVQDVVAFALARLGVLEEDAEPVERVPQHHQGKEGVGDAGGGFPLVLEKDGTEKRSLGEAL